MSMCSPIRNKLRFYTKLLDLHARGCHRDYERYVQASKGCQQASQTARHRAASKPARPPARRRPPPQASHHQGGGGRGSAGHPPRQILEFRFCKLILGNLKLAIYRFPILQVEMCKKMLEICEKTLTLRAPPAECNLQHLELSRLLANINLQHVEFQRQPGGGTCRSWISCSRSPLGTGTKASRGLSGRSLHEKNDLRLFYSLPLFWWCLEKKTRLGVSLSCFQNTISSGYFAWRWHKRNLTRIILAWIYTNKYVSPWSWVHSPGKGYRISKMHRQSFPDPRQNTQNAVQNPRLGRFWISPFAFS